MPNKFKLTIASFVMIFLTACGGGGGGGDSSNVAQESEGLWDGTTNTGRNASAIVFNDGTYYMVYTGEQNLNVSGVIQGSSSMNGSTFTSTDAKDFNLEGFGVLSAQVSGTVLSKQTMNTNITYDVGGTVSFTGSYNSDYELQPLLSNLAGQFSGQVASSAGVENADLTISPDGSMTGTSNSGCSLTGTAYERTDGNAFNISVTFANNVLCAFPGETFEGIAYYDTNDNSLFSAAPNASRDDGVIFVGTK
jgi:hypothetical protein